MIFFYTDSPKKEYLEKFFERENFYIIDYNIKNNFFLKNKFNSISYKKLYKDFNLVPYKNLYKDIKLNVVFSAICYDEKNADEKFDFIFDCKKDDYNFFNCIDSFLIRKKIKSCFEPKIVENFSLNRIEAKEIIKLSNFLLKTKIINDSNHFFDFIYNYYFYLNKNEKIIESDT